jgi:hypothetical protein
MCRSSSRRRAHSPMGLEHHPRPTGLVTTAEHRDLSRWSAELRQSPESRRQDGQSRPTTGPITTQSQPSHGPIPAQSRPRWLSPISGELALGLLSDLYAWMIPLSKHYDAILHPRS